jgi:hypothetical protein
MNSRFKDNFDVVGFPSNVTLESQSSRTDYLYDILRDVQTLSQCQAVVCGFSSNVKQILTQVFYVPSQIPKLLYIFSWITLLQVCRLILEMLTATYFDCEKRVLSVDGGYQYELWHHLLPTKVNPI